ncbi:MAG: glycosyltransferase [Hahellaceae bacterium]|nr:glycosyltransferase [Hahellaceae bacterium]
MKVGFISYPMLFQRNGGLQLQLIETKNALQNLDVDVEFINSSTSKLSHYDIVHVFAAIHGNEQIVHEAKRQNTRVVISPLQQPSVSYWETRRARLSSRLTGSITKYHVKTTYDCVKSAIKNAHWIIAQSEKEKEAIRLLYDVKENVSVISNGVASSYFSASPNLFCQVYGIAEGYVLVSGAISPYKNQMAAILATRPLNCPVVLVGAAWNQAYLDDCLNVGGGRVKYVGELPPNSDILASCYAAASVTVLASEGETFGLAVAESLAAGSAALITRKTGLDIPKSLPYFDYVDASDMHGLTKSISAAQMAPKNRELCRSLVSPFSWDQVVQEIFRTYKKIL